MRILNVILFTLYSSIALSQANAPITMKTTEKASIFSGLNPVSIVGTDSAYILRHFLRNDIRLFYGIQGTSLTYGSTADGNPNLNGDVYKNFSDFIGIGLTYKWINMNIGFALPSTTYLNRERANLTQFKLSASSSFRKFAFRAYIRDTKGEIAETPDAGSETTPSVHEFRVGAQFTYIFNAPKYSYRASLYQSEIQKKTAGSWMMRVEPFYRELGAKEGLVPTPYDTRNIFEDQVGLHYLYAPGLIAMPGYGATFSWHKGEFYISPMIFAGPGIAYNTYSSENGTFHKTNMEIAGNFMINAGQNGNRIYWNIQSTFSASYTEIDPAYLFTKNIEIKLVLGYRFEDIEGLIPRF